VVILGYQGPLKNQKFALIVIARIGIKKDVQKKGVLKSMNNSNEEQTKQTNAVYLKCDHCPHGNVDCSEWKTYPPECIEEE